MIQNVFKNDFMNCNGSLMGLRRKKWIFEEFWHVRAGKDHQDPKNSRKILKIVQTILARVLEVCLPVWYVPLHCKQSCKARLKNDKNLGQRNWVFVTNYDFSISISLQPNALDLR